jgi:hypothetical protein
VRSVAAIKPPAGTERGGDRGHVSNSRSGNAKKLSAAVAEEFHRPRREPKKTPDALGNRARERASDPPSSLWSKPVGMAPQFDFTKESGFRELK